MQEQRTYPAVQGGLGCEATDSQMPSLGLASLGVPWLQAFRFGRPARANPKSCHFIDRVFLKNLQRHLAAGCGRVSQSTFREEIMQLALALSPPHLLLEYNEANSSDNAVEVRNLIMLALQAAQVVLTGKLKEAP